MQNLSAAEFIQARARFHRLRQGWREIQPTEGLRAQAESLLDRYQLRAADALQLSAVHLGDESPGRSGIRFWG
jgi:predicted nucleic acid-binding protein